jgi:hypothetical protein
MASYRSRRILQYLHGNVTKGVESLSDARSFVRLLDALDYRERLFLECALVDRAYLRQFRSAI